MNTFIHGDCLQVLNTIPDQSIDMIFADPPYNLQLRKMLKRPDGSVVHGVSDAWDQFNCFEEYDHFTRSWLQATRRVLKNTGTIWVIGSYHNIFRLGTALQDLKYWILNEVVWIKHNPMPHFHGKRLTNAHETLIWAAKNQQSSYTFHYHALKNFNEDLQLRSDWYFPICHGHERLKNKDGKTIHSAQKPEALLYRVITATTNPGDLVLDLFSGSGTTSAVCKKLGRRFIAIDQDQSYINEARKRLESIKCNSNHLYMQPYAPKNNTRIPFGHLLEVGLLKAGDVLKSSCGQFTAHIYADGSIESENIRGSIHKVAAHLAGKDTQNGWTYWRFRNAFIDHLRSQFHELQKEKISRTDGCTDG